GSEVNIGGLHQRLCASLEGLFPLIMPSRPFLRRTSNRCFFGGPFLSYWLRYCLLTGGDCISRPGSRRLLEEHEPSIRLKSSGLEIPLGPPIGLVEEYRDRVIAALRSGSAL